MKHNTVLICVAGEFLYEIKQNGELGYLYLDIFGCIFYNYSTRARWI